MNCQAASPEGVQIQAIFQSPTTINRILGC